MALEGLSNEKGASAAFQSPSKHAYHRIPPSLLPIPALDRHIVATGEDEWKRRVYSETSNIVGVSFKVRDLCNAEINDLSDARGCDHALPTFSNVL